MPQVTEVLRLITTDNVRVRYDCGHMTVLSYALAKDWGLLGEDTSNIIVRCLDCEQEAFRNARKKK